VGTRELARLDRLGELLGGDLGEVLPDNVYTVSAKKCSLTSEMDDLLWLM
jgi:hypothetical protein